MLDLKSIFAKIPSVVARLLRFCVKTALAFERDWLTPVIRYFLSFSRLVGVLTIFGLIGFFIVSHWTVERIANVFYSHSLAPSDRELPQTAGAPSFASHDIQVLGGQGAGLNCSIPPIAEWLAFSKQERGGPRNGANRKRGHASISIQMRQACVFHDYCYRHGAATYGYSQADCDHLLLQHAYRLCRYLRKEKQISQCIGLARKVTLGVRFGGNKSFKRADKPVSGEVKAVAPNEHKSRCRAGSADAFEDSCTSTYFEFDPYPVQAKTYRIYRVADAPDRWIREGGARKALYTFFQRPTGVSVSIEGWTADMSPRTIRFRLPGDVQFLNTAPLVAGSHFGNSTSPNLDWLIWWRRRNLNQTGGYFAMLAPRFAEPEDWKRTFSSRRAHHLRPCQDRPMPFSEERCSRWWKAELDASFKNPGDNGFSEVHAAPGFEPKTGTRVMTLRTTPCSTRPDRNSPCYLDLLLDASGPRHQKTEPRLARDSFNRTIGKGTQLYRNFALPPVILSGDQGGPTLAWFRRGLTDGIGHDHTAFLRRQGKVAGRERAKSHGIVKVAGLADTMDPPFVIDRTSPRPWIASLHFNQEQKRTRLLVWRLPSIATSKERDELKQGGCYKRHRNGAVPNHCSKFVGPTDLTDTCGLSDVDQTWLTRPASIVKLGPDKTAIVLARLSERAGGADTVGDSVMLEVRSITIGHDASCTLSKTITRQLPIQHPSSLKPENQRDRDVVQTETYLQIRATPLLFFNGEKDGAIDLIFPARKRRLGTQAIYLPDVLSTAQ